MRWAAEAHNLSSTQALLKAGADPRELDMSLVLDANIKSELIKARKAYEEKGLLSAAISACGKLKDKLRGLKF